MDKQRQVYGWGQIGHPVRVVRMLLLRHAGPGDGERWTPTWADSMAAAAMAARLGGGGAAGQALLAASLPSLHSLLPPRDPLCCCCCCCGTALGAEGGVDVVEDVAAVPWDVEVGPGAACEVLGALAAEAAAGAAELEEDEALDGGGLGLPAAEADRDASGGGVPPPEPEAPPPCCCWDAAVAVGGCAVVLAAGAEAVEAVAPAGPPLLLLVAAGPEGPAAEVSLATAAVLLVLLPAPVPGRCREGRDRPRPWEVEGLSAASGCVEEPAPLLPAIPPVAAGAAGQDAPGAPEVGGCCCCCADWDWPWDAVDEVVVLLLPLPAAAPAVAEAVAVPDPVLVLPVAEDVAELVLASDGVVGCGCHHIHHAPPLPCCCCGCWPPWAAAAAAAACAAACCCACFACGLAGCTHAHSKREARHTHAKCSLATRHIPSCQRLPAAA